MSPGMAMFAELRRRGVLGAVVAYGVAAAGALQLADIVVHSMELPAWTLRALIWLSALGLPVTALVSWFYDLTRHGFVRTQMPGTPPASPSPALPPAMLRELQDGALLAGRYKLQGELGKGAMGRVLAAQDEKLGRRVAVKVVTGAHDPARIQRFIQEARTAGALEHPNVLAVYDLGEHEGVPFLVTELLEGHTLRTLLNDGALPAAQAQSLGSQLARGLAAAHARGIVHRDLKPENLFVTNDGRLKILDFGLARLVNDDSGPGLTQTGAVFGTPGYLSPEQARGEKVGPPSDVFSAGVVLHEMLSGRRAFPGANLIEAGHAALTAEPVPLPITTPPALEGIVTRALQKEPSKRFADGGELARSIDALAPGAQPLPPAASAWRRSTAVMAVLAAVAIGAVVASAMHVGRTVREKLRGPSAPAEAEQPAPPAPGHPAKTARRGTPAAPVEPPAVPAVPPVPKIEIPEVPDAETLRREIAKGIAQKDARSAGRLGLLTGARVLEQTGQVDRAVELLRKQRDPVAHLELFLLLRRQKRAAEGRADLLDFMKKQKDAEWPAPLLQAYAGQKGDADALAAAKGDSDDLCEAYYYLGRLHAPENPQLAREQLGKASNEDCDQADAAREALKGL